MTGLPPGLGRVSDSPGPLWGHMSGCVCCGECFSCSFCWMCLLRWGTRSSDDVSHFLGGTHHGRCVHTMTRGLEIRVLDGDDTRLLIHTYSSRTRILWGVGDEEVLSWWGDVWGGLWMVFLGGTGEGKRNLQGKYCRVVFGGDSRFQTVPFFMLYTIYYVYYESIKRELNKRLTFWVSVWCKTKS